MAPALPHTSYTYVHMHTYPITFATYASCKKKNQITTKYEIQKGFALLNVSQTSHVCACMCVHAQVRARTGVCRCV